MELRGSDQLCKDVTEIVSIWQLTIRTKFIQHGVLYLTDQKIDNVEHRVRDQGAYEPEINMNGGLPISHTR
jgi:hypothetical protein